MKSIASILLFVFGSLFVAAVWLATLCTSQEEFGTASLDPLFTGLALVAATAVFAHEREKAADAEKEHTELIKETREAYRIRAITTKLARIQGRKDRLGLSTVQSAIIHFLYDENSKKLEEELDRVIGMPQQ